MTVSLIQPTFARGEVGPEISARTDLSAYQTGLAKCINFIISPYGGALNRPGTRFLAQTRGNEVARMVRFKFSLNDTYALEFTHLKMRVFRNGERVVFSSGPSIGQVYEITTPFTRDELFDLNYTQSADVMDIVHPAHKPQKLKRFGHDNWTIGPVSLVPNISPPASATATPDGGGTSPTTQAWTYQITSVVDDGSQTLEESLPVTSNTIAVKIDVLRATVTWPAAPGASYYNVYKDNAGAGIFGFVGRANTTSFSDFNIAPTKTDTPPTGTDPFVGDNNYPRAVGYFQQRLVYASTNNKPQTLWFSRTGVFTNFGYSFPTKDDDAITWTIASAEVNRINHLTPLRALMTFTDGTEWIIQGQTTGFTPKTINGDPQTYNGIGKLRPLVLNNTAIYAQERGRSVTAFGYSLDSDGFSGSDISILAPQMLQDYSLVDWDYQKIPYSIIWGAREDGMMVSITYLADQQVIAWHRHQTDGKVLSVCSVPEGREDAIYMCVERIVGGEAKRYVERMASRQTPRYNNQVQIKYSWFLDSALQYNGVNVSSTTMTLTGGIEWKYPELITLTCSQGIFDAGAINDEIQYLADPGAEPFRLQIVQYVSPTVVKVRPKGVVPDAIRGTSFVDWAFARNTMAGLGHLEGRRVSVLSDGNVFKDVLVTGGTIELETPGGVVTIGLPYECELQTLEVTIPNSETIKDKTKIVSQVTAVLLESRGGFYGRSSDESDLWEFKPRRDEDEYGAIQAFTGTETQVITDAWSGNGQITVMQKDPLPLNILALIPRVDTGGAY